MVMKLEEIALEEEFAITRRELADASQDFSELVANTKPLSCKSIFLVYSVFVSLFNQ